MVLLYVLGFLITFLSMVVLPAVFAYLFSRFGIEVGYVTMFITNLVAMLVASGIYLPDQEKK